MQINQDTLYLAKNSNGRWAKNSLADPPWTPSPTPWNSLVPAHSYPGQPLQPPRLVPWTIPPETLPPLKPRKRKNENALFGGIGQLGGSGWRGSIRLVKLVWLVLPKKLGNGPKGPIYPKRSKNVKNRDFHTHPCGFYIKHRPFPMHSMDGP